MKRHIYILLVLLFSLSCYKCQEEDPFDYDIEYQDGYPNIMAGNWKAIDFAVVGQETIPIGNNEYELVTALDPNNEHSLIIDNIYNSNLRVRTFIDRTTDRFYVTRGDQLEETNALYDVEKISINGRYIDDPNSGEVLVIETGLYDEFNDLYDTLIILGFRKTGFEDVEEYEFDFIFENE